MKILRFFIHNRKTILKAVAILVLSIVAFNISHEYATSERGYIALGGEIFIPFLIIFAKDIWKIIKATFSVVVK